MTTIATPLLTTAEVAKRMRVGPGTIDAGDSTTSARAYLRVGGIYRYPTGDLEEWISESVRHSIAS